MTLNYEVWDAIADCYIPALGLIALFLIWKDLFLSKLKSGWDNLTLFCILIATAYGWMWVDQQCHVWVAWGLDYSTHTAVSLALVLFLSFVESRKCGWWGVSFVAYLLLMRYQRYHTVTDMLTTTLAGGVPMLITLKIWNGLKK